MFVANQYPSFKPFTSVNLFKAHNWPIFFDYETVILLHCNSQRKGPSQFSPPGSVWLAVGWSHSWQNKTMTVQNGSFGFISLGWHFKCIIAGHKETN